MRLAMKKIVCPVSGKASTISEWNKKTNRFYSPLCPVEKKMRWVLMLYQKIILCGGRYDAMTDESLNEYCRFPLFINRYSSFVDEKELAENGILRPEEHIVI